MGRYKFYNWMAPLLAITIALALATAPALAAPKNTPQKPILTKSGKQAALKQAADAVILAVPGSPTDQAAVPHYFGPFPNWANSPFTLPDATVEITGDGTGATATGHGRRRRRGHRHYHYQPGQRLYGCRLLTITGCRHGRHALKRWSARPVWFPPSRYRPAAAAIRTLGVSISPAAARPRMRLPSPMAASMRSRLSIRRRAATRSRRWISICRTDRTG